MSSRSKAGALKMKNKFKQMNKKNAILVAQVCCATKYFLFCCYVVLVAI